MRTVMSETVLLVSILSLAISVVFALSNHVQHQAIQFMEVFTGTVIIVGTALVILLVLTPLYLEPATLMSPAIGWFVLAGLIVPSLSMTLHTTSVRLLGPAVSSALTSTSPVFAIAIAVTFLAEAGGLLLYVGTAVIISGIAYLALRSRRSRVNWPLWAILIPLGAALCRGLAHNVVKLGLNDLPNPLTAALVTSTVSLVVLLIALRVTGTRMPSWNPGYWWYALCGTLNGVGLVGLNLAIEMGTITLVAPLVSTTPVFTLLLGWLVFRKESVSVQTVLAMAVIFSGCLMIILR